MTPAGIVINIFNGDVQDVFWGDETVEVLVVNWDVDASQVGESGICEVELPNSVLNAAVSSSQSHPLRKLAGSDVDAALQAACAQGVLPEPGR